MVIASMDDVGVMATSVKNKRIGVYQCIIYVSYNGLAC